MSPRRPPPEPPKAPEPPESPVAAGSASPGLLRKYRELLSKHEALVHKLDERTTLHVSTFKLSSWALETSASALAVLREGGVVLANARWHALSRERGPWRRDEEGRLQGPTYTALRDLAEAEAKAVLPRKEGGARVTRYRRVRGPQLQVLEMRSERVTHPQGGQVLVLVRDISAQARDEEELAQARATLMERAQLRALGELAAGIAHDLRNTLNAMRLRLQLLQRDEAATGERGQHHLDALARIVADAGERVGRLQDFSRQRGSSTVERVQLSDVIRDAVDIARGGIEHRKAGQAPRLDVVLPAKLPAVSGSSMELRYVLINLLINARDAMPKGGTIRVRAVKTGKSVRVTVEDEGTGIPEEHLPNIFKAFFTTKGNKGTGLGLSMAYGVVTRAGGKLTAANRPEGGAVFTLTFPALKAAPARKKSR
ncbi:sensor histidine kinase [Corallococcus sp. CA053C]|uniref:sensor histidine kinase n=1 Tax=Corallococcus sp. CA053C TaxID=2316732 RepID=UPI000EA3E950|nr:ATP-binding protein [Corallococcus sp. CA053C]RKH15198.1 sensor histidine kinase [Corallococcus sp. CA053C]